LLGYGLGIGPTIHAALIAVARPDSTVLLVVYQRLSVDAVLVNTVGRRRGPGAGGRDVVRRALTRLSDASSTA
jgi:hypothetical protein